MSSESVWGRVRTATRDLLTDLRAAIPHHDLPQRPYVFILGFNKTATTTMHHFFRGNGFRAIHWDNGRLARTMVRNCMQDQRILAGYDHRFHVFSDMILHTTRIRIEANSLFRVLDRDYPEAFFLFNHRPTSDWIASRDRKQVQRLGMTFTQLDQLIYAASSADEVFTRWAEEKSRFEHNVRDHFRNHPRYLEFDIADPTVPLQIRDLLGCDMDVSHWGHYRTNPLLQSA